MTQSITARFKKLTCPLPPGSRVVAYARDSGGDEQERSVDQQLQLYTEYCCHFGLTLVEGFADRARKGSSVVGREGFDRMIQLLREHGPEPELSRRRRRIRALPDQEKVQGILIWKSNRFGRDLNDAQFFKADIRRRGYVIISLADNIPEAGDLTPVFETLLDWKAQRDLYDISSDAKRGLAALVTSKNSEGAYESFAPGTPPRCFKRVQVQIGNKRNGQPRIVSRWVPDKTIWKRGQKAWALRAAGASLAAVHRATRLYKGKNGYVTFFHNKIYLGIFEFGDLTLENFVPALCTQEQWDAVQALPIFRPGPNVRWVGRHPHQRSGNAFIFSGLLKCAMCGAPMTGETGSRARGRPAWRFYICSRKSTNKSACLSSRLGAANVESIILEKLCGEVLTLESAMTLFGMWASELVADSTADTSHVAGLREQHAQVKRAIANLITAIESGQAGPTIIATLAQREHERADLEEAIGKASRRPDLARAIQPSDEQLLLFLKRLRDKLQNGDRQEVKAFLSALVVEIQAGPQGGKVTYVLPQ